MVPNASNVNGGLIKANTEIIIMWKMTKANGTGYTVPVTMMTISPANGFYMVFLLDLISYGLHRITGNNQF